MLLNFGKTKKMTPKQKALELVDKFNGKTNALSVVNETIENYKSTSMFYLSKVKILPKIFWLEVKTEIEKL